MLKNRKIINTLLIAVMFISVGSSIFAYKTYRMVSLVKDTHDNFKYIATSGEPIGDVPSSTAFSPVYLQAVFGENPALLQRLQEVISRGVQRTDDKLNVRRVAAMLVCYRINESNEVYDVAAHIIGDVEAGRRRPGFHRHGYFRNLVDRNIWNIGNTVVSFTGREIIFFAEEKVQEQQERIIASLGTGDILPIVDAIEEPYFYTLVIPNPRKLLPPQLRNHVQTLVIKGNLQQNKGHTSAMAICVNEKSATFTASVLNDLKTAAEAVLKTKFGGVIKEKPWGNTVETWWAYRMVLTSEDTIIEPEYSIVNIETDTYGREMVNVILKSIERMGRDLFQMRGSLEQKKDPRLVDYEMRSPHPRHYWSPEHKWGPNWPISSTNLITQTSTNAVTQSTPSDRMTTPANEL